MFRYIKLISTYLKILPTKPASKILEVIKSLKGKVINFY